MGCFGSKTKILIFGASNLIHMAKPLLWVPKTVSFNPTTKKGYQSRGTKAFVALGTKLPAGLVPTEKHRHLRHLAHPSKFFTKPDSVHTQKIREKLKAAGISAEEPIQSIGNGRALFMKSGFSLESPAGMRQFVNNTREVVEKICKTVGKMHSIGITHNHLHLGNIAITKGGKIVLLDLSRAKFSLPGKNFVGYDIVQLGKSLSGFYAYCVKEFQNREVSKNEIADFKNQIFGKILYNTLINSGETKADWKTFEKFFYNHLPKYKSFFNLS